jgi:hypothetical protein
MAAMRRASPAAKTSPEIVEQLSAWIPIVLSGRNPDSSSITQEFPIYFNYDKWSSSQATRSCYHVVIRDDRRFLSQRICEIHETAYLARIYLFCYSSNQLAYFLRSKQMVIPRDRMLR